MADPNRRREGDFLYFDPSEHPSLELDSPYNVPEPGRPMPVEGMPLSWDPAQHPALALSGLPPPPVSNGPARQPAIEGMPLAYDRQAHPSLSLPARADARPAAKRPAARAATPAPIMPKGLEDNRAVAALVARENEKMKREREDAIIERLRLEIQRAAQPAAGPLPPLTKQSHMTGYQQLQYDRFHRRPARRDKKA